MVPSGTTAGNAVEQALDQVIDEFEVDGTRGWEMVRELERRTGGVIHGRYSVSLEGCVDQLAVATRTYRTARPTVPASVVIRGATVEQLLRRIFAPVPSSGVTIDRGAKEVRWSLKVTRVHRLDRELLLPNAPSMQNWVLICHNPDNLNDPLDGTMDNVLRFGDRLIVHTTPCNHWLVDQFLREAVKAQQPAAHP
jgi:hypothetical protein